MTDTVATAAILLARNICSAVFVSLLAARQQRRSTELRVQTDLVGILASVTDAKGSRFPISRRTRSAFRGGRAAEDCERFEAQTNRPLDLALMVDSSMSAFKDMKIRDGSGGAFHPAGGAARRHARRLRIR